MSAYDWARLLVELEDKMQVCDQTTATTIKLWEELSKQLNGGRPVRMIHEQNPDPQFRPKKPEPVPAVAPKVNKPWWKFLS